MHLDFNKDKVKELISENLEHYCGTDADTCTPVQMYKAVCRTVRNITSEFWADANEGENANNRKRVVYLSMEFLPGTSLRNNLFNLKLLDVFSAALEEMGSSMDLLNEMEPDAGLGNGGLGRLASCYLDAMSGLGISGYGMSILYEYGIFRQKIENRRQVELPDEWLTLGDVWLLHKDEEGEKVRFGGKLEEFWDESGKLKIVHSGYSEVIALPRDLHITGYNSPTVNTLRLWEASSPITIDMGLFAKGKYLQSMEEKHMAEVISKILYPEDAHTEGKLLRLKQQYFFISASMQFLVRKHLRQYGTLENFADKVAIHINDTHPTLAIPELIRLLVDENDMDWDDAFDIVKRCVSYTNHTIMPEALERWPMDLFSDTLPRLFSIIREINRRQGINLMQSFPNEEALRKSMAILEGNQVKMANLCVECAHTVNGVSGLHSGIIRDSLFNGFARQTPEKFTSVTNGIAYRRWLCQANPLLASKIEELIGPAFKDDAAKLEDLLRFADDSSVQYSLRDIKRRNKLRLAAYVKDNMGINVDPDSIFDIQVKRLHEYKRQLLNALHIIHLYETIKNNPSVDIPPRTFFFGAKSAAGYRMAKDIIHLINALSDMIEADGVVRDRIRVIFLENYSVSLSEIIMPAAEVSEQISLAGKEASGTGNMKLMINGALTIGTLDGANVEINQQVGDENMFLFGMRVEEVDRLVEAGSYNPWSLIQTNPDLKAIMNRLSRGIAGDFFPSVVNSLSSGNGGVADPYFNLADFDSYKKAQEAVAQTYIDVPKWQRMSIVNIAKSGLFSADRAVAEYAERIWNIPIPGRQD